MMALLSSTSNFSAFIFGKLFPSKFLKFASRAKNPGNEIPMVDTIENIFSSPSKEQLTVQQTKGTKNQKKNYQAR
jgi:hypothetical protein